MVNDSQTRCYFLDNYTNLELSALIEYGPTFFSFFSFAFFCLPLYLFFYCIVSYFLVLFLFFTFLSFDCSVVRLLTHWLNFGQALIDFYIFFSRHKHDTLVINMIRVIDWISANMQRWRNVAKLFIWSLDNC